MKREDLMSKYPHFYEVGNDYVIAIVDGEKQEFTINDVYLGVCGNPLSGFASFGPVGGDHRPIRSIYEAVKDYFVNEFPHYFEKQEQEYEED
jgi:hypothetical protein